jgi:hypothetical protein
MAVTNFSIDFSFNPGDLQEWISKPMTVNYSNAFISFQSPAGGKRQQQPKTDKGENVESGDGGDRKVDDDNDKMSPRSEPESPPTPTSPEKEPAAAEFAEDAEDKSKSRK